MLKTWIIALLALSCQAVWGGEIASGAASAGSSGSAAASGSPGSLACTNPAFNLNPAASADDPQSGSAKDFPYGKDDPPGMEIAPVWSGHDLMMLSIFLAMLVGLLALSIWARRFLVHGSGKGRDIAIVARQAIDARNSLLIVRVRGRDFLIGSSQGNVNLLTMVPKAAPAEDAESRPAEGQGGIGEKTDV